MPTNPRLVGIHAAVCVLLVAVSLQAKNLIQNGEFDDGLNHWGSGWINTGAGAEVTFDVNEDGLLSGDNCWQMNVLNGTDTDYYIQRTQDCPITAGNTYELSFMGTFDGSQESINIIAALENGEDGEYFRYIDETIELLKSAEEYGPFVYTAEEDDPEVDLKFFVGGNDNVIIYLDAIVVDDGLPETGVGASPEDLLPDKVILDQNYPNPFNPSTRIFYHVPEASRVRMTVFDLQGREITTLVDAFQSAGSYVTEFSGRDLPSGSYFYRLESDNQIITKRMMLLK